MERMFVLAAGQSWQPLLESAGVLGAMIVIVLVVHTVLYLLFRHLASRTTTDFDDSLVRHFREPSRWTLLFLGVKIVLPLIALPEEIIDAVNHMLSLGLIALIAWAVVKVFSVLEDHIRQRYDVTVRDNLRARKIHTQLRVLKRIAIIIVCIVALSTALMTFDQIRQLGTTILASAGILGIVIGMAAQKTIGTFIAGIQIALTQPIRIDDVVIVENEWGRIEEITLTYVVVKIWDQRRLIVPITYFIDQPFQNWTRVSADLLGTIYLYLDYTIPLEEVRKELERLAEASDLWDKKVCGLQVTNATERTIEVRALLSAADASLAWSLRCQVREKLIAFIQKNYPQCLPRYRGELQTGEKRDSASG